MFDIDNYVSSLTELLLHSFGKRLVYVGLQGSYLRGEATPESDIDIMAVIDNLCVEDLNLYRSAIQSIGHFDKSCGFICSTEDLLNWNPLEICNLMHGTRDYYGTLSTIVPAYTKDDMKNFIKISLNNMYHELCHRYIHAEDNKNPDALTATYKGVFFILQNLYYLRSGRFILTKKELSSLLSDTDRDVLVRSMELASGITHDFDESFAILFTWCQDTMKSV